ncbi:MAG: PAS domain-containing protein [Rhodoferax sp.]|uniref:PAS domain-containing protein n=1 Tax=Rhodoferax sp. TaxID=50421 RepID=UPI00260DC9C8|nr:PAS domain-containing protein [Rhodoferax sp.]MDD5334925.1 PAS domain-containing protein [Rhodoferax sp.]
MRINGGFSRRSTFLLVTLSIAACASAATVFTLWRLRTEAINRQFQVATLYARAFEDHLTQSFNVIDLTLANVVNESQPTATLAEALRHAPYLRSLSVLDTQETIVASSDPRNVGVSVAAGDFLPPAPESRGVLRVGRPWVGHDFHDGRAASLVPPAAPDAAGLIPVRRDISLDHDHWVPLLASVNSDYFLNYYSHSVAAATGVVELLRYDGTLLLSTDEKQRPGGRARGTGLVSKLAQEEFGQFEQSWDDGRAVLTAYRSSRAYPFLIVVHLDKDVGLAGWRREAARTLAVVGSMLLLALALAGLYFVRTERAARQRDADVKQLRLSGAALEAAANAIIITDRMGTIEWANPAFCALSGYTLEEALGHNPRELIKSGVQTPGDYQELWHTILSGDVWRGELINRRKDDTQYLEGQTITPVRDEDGTIGHFISVKRDITERKLVEDALKKQMKFAHALNQIAEAIAAHGVSSSILEVAASVVGETLAVDGALIYHISFEKQQLIGLCEWLNPQYPDLMSAKTTYPLDMFAGAAGEMRRTQHWLVSQADNINPHFLEDGSDQLLHHQMKIKSLLWYPFDFRDDACHLLVLNQIHSKVKWSNEEFDFLAAVSQQVSIALTKIHMMDERRQSEQRMHELSRHLVVVQESTRRRLSSELHQRTSPNLAAIGVNLDVVNAIMREQQSPVLSARIDDIRALIEDTTASIREICSDLRPPVLDYAGLVAALESYVKQFQRRTSITVRIDCTSPAVRLAPVLESALFRIVQEALTNCAKHSRAKSIVVALNLDRPPVALLVSDDGIGFDLDLLGKTSHTSGLGILTMREMAEFSGAKFTLESSPGQGTRIKVEMYSVEGQT